MVAGLEKVYTVVAHQVCDAVLLCQAAGPDSRAEVFERLGFADTLDAEWMDLEETA
jgi:hypothetical protein